MPSTTASDRAVPHNLEAERALLGSILLDNSALNMALEVVGRDDFFSEAHRITLQGRADREGGRGRLPRCPHRWGADWNLRGRLGVLPHREREVAYSTPDQCVEQRYFTLSGGNG